MTEIIFLGLGYGNQARVLIYDSLGVLIYRGQTCNGRILVKLNRGAIYHIKAKFMGMIMDKCFYVGKNNIYTFWFPNIIYDKKIVTFLLTDYYYDNLPIERGEIILWQK